MSNKPKNYRKAEQKVRSTEAPAKKKEASAGGRTAVIIAYIVQFALAAVATRFLVNLIPVAGSGSTMRVLALMVVFAAIWLALYYVAVKPLERKFHLEEEEEFEAPTLE